MASNKDLKKADILAKILAGSSEAELLEEGYTLAEIRSATSEHVKALIKEFEGMTPERAFAEWLLAKQPIVHSMLEIMRKASPRDAVAAGMLLDRIQDAKLAKALELGIIRKTEEGKDTIVLSDTELAARAKEMLKELEDLGDSNIIDMAPRRVQAAR